MGVHQDVYLKLDLIRIFAEKVIEDMELSAGGDEYKYTGTTGDIDTLKDCIAEFHLALDAREIARMKARGEL